MAWQTPVTDRVSGAVHTLADQNRITGNIHWLTTQLRAKQLYSGANLQKVTYVYNDYITVANWEDILSVLSALVESLALETEGQATDKMTFSNMNTVESLTLAIYDRYMLLLSQSNNNHYAGDDIYPEGDMSIYSAGLAV